VREDLAPGDYGDPGWYKHPRGTVAYEVDAAGRTPRSRPSAGKPGQVPGMNMPMQPGGEGHQH